MYPSDHKNDCFDHTLDQVLFCFGGLYAHHYFWERVSSTQIFLENLVSRFSNLLVMILCFMETSFPPPFEF